MRIPLILTCLLAAIATLAMAAAAPTDRPKPEDAKEIAWPEAPRPRFQVAQYYEMFDEVPIPAVQFTCEDVRFKLAGRPGTSIESSSAPTHSLEITDRAIPKVWISISVFSAKEFLPDLSEPNWSAYQRWLKRQHPDASIVFDDSNLDKPATPYVLNQKFRQLAYETKVANGQTSKTREIFAFVGSSLLVVRAVGNKADIDSNWQQVDQLIGEFSSI